MLQIKKKDTVIMLAGKDKGKKGEVLKVYPETRRVLVAKVNFIKRHTRATQTDPGGIREKEAPVPISKVMLVCPKCSKPTRTKIDFLADGKKARACRKCGEMLI
jgi:large subunit ribosomal protein L24